MARHPGYGSATANSPYDLGELPLENFQPAPRRRRRRRVRRVAPGDPGVAMVLSFLLPGLGHLYRQRPLRGLLWFLAYALGLAFFIVPGLIVWVMAMIDAKECP